MKQHAKLLWKDSTASYVFSRHVTSASLIDRQARRQVRWARFLTYGRKITRIFFSLLAVMFFFFYRWQRLLHFHYYQRPLSQQKKILWILFIFCWCDPFIGLGLFSHSHSKIFVQGVKQRKGNYFCWWSKLEAKEQSIITYLSLSWRFGWEGNIYYFHHWRVIYSIFKMFVR